MTERDKLPPIKFAALNDELLARAETLVPMWLPGGVKRGHEYACAGLQGGPGSSCSVNLKKGVWKDFATDEAGPDLISLYAAIHGLDQGPAAVQLARDYGLEDVAGVTRDTQHKPVTPPPSPPPSKKKTASDEGWRTMMPVPEAAPEATFKHQYRALNDIEHTAAYRKDGHLLGYVVRFRTSDGGKETLPYTWCTSARDGASRWHWKQWDEPRPLYFPGGVSPGGLYEAGQPPRTVVLVEGEKKAEALQALLDTGSPGVYLVVSWPGGCKAWKKALWEWLAGCTVLLWPDCDAKRVPLTKKEREACLDDVARETAQAMKPLLPEYEQPGMAAMLGIGALLRDAHMCTVQLLPIPKPGDVDDGWDCADAITRDGWDCDRVLTFFGQAQPLPANAASPEPKTVGSGGGSGKNRDRLVATGDGDDAFRDYLNFLCDQFKCEPHEISVNRKVVIVALRKAPALQGCLGLNLLTGAPSTQYPWPWRENAGPLEDGDALRLGDWLSTEYKLKAASKAALEEAIDTVADAHRFHPIRDWLESLKHDGTSRIDKWLIYVLGKDPETLSPRRCKYLQMAGRFILMGLVARVMEPGCKFDYSLVLEGLTGRGKSTFVKTLVGEDYFSDTHFDIGAGKDGFEQLEGLWGYELSELTALRKADSEQVKGFFSSTADRFRGAYGKYVKKHPRQCVIFCSTNKMRYLYDLTGNRRFWPIWIDQYIKLAWLKKFREQLFAEALLLYRQGERYAPTPEEDKAYFEPEQQLRLVETAVQSRLYTLLTREGGAAGEGRLSVELSVNTDFVTLDRLVAALGSDAAKSNAQLENQIRGWLESHGWVYKRAGSAAGGGPRPYGYRRPKVWPPQFKDDDQEGDEEPGRSADLKKAPDAPGNENGGDDSEPF